jgi:zinc transport system ATP-binding protein
MRIIRRKILRGVLPVIEAKNLSFSYTGSPPYVLNGLDFEIQNGAYVSVVGENGCGKSTLIRLILKFLKPTGGSIVSGVKKIGYVPQKNDDSSANFPITVYEALNSYRRLIKVKGKEATRQALEDVGMSGWEKALVGSLSGGQHQKILIARALMGNPDLLVLDEPSTGVDRNSQMEIYGFLKKINVENGVTIVSVEHNLEAAIANSTLIYHLTGGQGHLCTPQQYADEFLNGRKKEDA